MEHKKYWLTLESLPSTDNSFNLSGVSITRRLQSEIMVGEMDHGKIAFSFSAREKAEHEDYYEEGEQYFSTPPDTDGNQLWANGRDDRGELSETINLFSSFDEALTAAYEMSPNREKWAVNYFYFVNIDHDKSIVELKPKYLVVLNNDGFPTRYEVSKSKLKPHRDIVVDGISIAVSEIEYGSVSGMNMNDIERLLSELKPNDMKVMVWFHENKVDNFDGDKGYRIYWLQEQYSLTEDKATKIVNSYYSLIEEGWQPSDN